MNVRGWLMAAALAGMASYSFGQIKGKVLLDGDPPEAKQIDMSGVQDCAKQHADPVSEESVVVGKDKQLANVVVSIKPAEGVELKGDVPKDPAVLDQKACMYHPHVLAMMVGQDLLISNSDPFLHNVHTQPTENETINRGQANIDKPGIKAPPMKTEERFKVKCDVHPWMAAWINVFNHPFFAVSKDDGTYEIQTKGLKDGKYTLLFWQEASGEPKEQEIEVKDGKADAGEFKMPVGSAAAPAENNVKLASQLAPSEKTCCSNDCESSAAVANSEPGKKVETGPQAKAN